MKAHKLKGALFAWYPTEKFYAAFATPPDPGAIEAFIVPAVPEGYVLSVYPHGSSAAVETASLRLAEDLAKGAVRASAIITYGPPKKAPTP